MDDLLKARKRRQNRPVFGPLNMYRDAANKGMNFSPCYTLRESRNMLQMKQRKWI